MQFAIYIYVQQQDYVYNTTTKKEEVKWFTIAEAVVGPEYFGRKISNPKLKESPEVCKICLFASKIALLYVHVCMYVMHIVLRRMVRVASYNSLYKMHASILLLLSRVTHQQNKINL